MQNLTLIDLWNQMGGVAKSVAIVLFIMSIWSISVAVERFLTYYKARTQSRELVEPLTQALKENRLDDALALTEQYNKSHLAKVIASGLQEFRAHQQSKEIPGEAVEASRRALERATAITLEEFKRGLGGLATIASTSPFIGLFGTTFGIINAFMGMSAAQSAGIAAVAAGIAEALITTAFGILVAVIAVVFYNYFMTKIDSFTVEMDNSSSELVDYFIQKKGATSGK
jgi:biopolymer transport protein ExbB/TolQ